MLSRKTFCYYAEHILPNLLPHQKENLKVFAVRLQNNWGQGGGKFLHVMFDKKWMWGLVVRQHAKSCKKKGLQKKYLKAYHRNHINKVMLTAFTAFAFDDHFENGGGGEARDISRAIDCAVTGSNDGTATDPKCCLQRIFKFHVFPAVRKLVGLGGRYEGYTPVGQGDGTGPHVETAFLQFLKESCEREGWVWEPQVVQMPHANILDLLVFPAISRRHCAIARKGGGAACPERGQNLGGGAAGMGGLT
uniref:Uncharacterized protein n=1 Tax=Corethron hystrix TaxID=216773 RepID=A0A6U5I0W1_9STRA|mmetsp:Transcript_31242/g.71442  ORF Transcript_31242/g.71442 Transcript_31242/m.71442 type:complete len:248 (+) Transcript_31242:1254-1997(+)